MIKSIDTIGFHLYDKWLTNLRNGKRIESFFCDNYYKRIAIYGMGIIGMQVLDELRNSSIKVSYGIDRNAREKRVEGLDVITPNTMKALPQKIDAIVVTPMQYFFEIEKMLLDLIEKKIDIVSIEQIVEYVSRDRQD